MCVQNMDSVVLLKVHWLKRFNVQRCWLPLKTTVDNGWMYMYLMFS